jgi:hypothetical protein
MEPLFEKICDETSEYTKIAVQQSKQKEVDDEKWFDTTHSLHREKKSDKKVCCVLQQGQKE